jgi:hypothetical protein
MRERTRGGSLGEGAGTRLEPADSG